MTSARRDGLRGWAAAGVLALLGWPAIGHAQEVGLTDTTIRIGMFAPLSGSNMA